jgi:type IV pilus assembly protein PilM
VAGRPWWASTSGPPACAPPSSSLGRGGTHARALRARSPCRRRGARRRGGRPDAVAAAVRQLWAQARFRTSRSSSASPTRRSSSARSTCPGMPLEELRAVPGLQVQDYIPCRSSTRSSTSTRSRRSSTTPGTPVLRVLLVAACPGHGREHPRSRAHRAGLQASMVDLTSSRSCAPRSASPARAGADRGGAGRHRCPRHEHRGAPGRRPALRAASCSWAVRTSPTPWRSAGLGLPSDEAERLKRSAGLSAVPPRPRTMPASRAIDSTGSALVEEVHGRSDYSSSQPRRPPRAASCCPAGGSRLSGLSERLSSATRLPVEFAHPMSVLRARQHRSHRRAAGDRRAARDRPGRPGPGAWRRDGARRRARDQSRCGSRPSRRRGSTCCRPRSASGPASSAAARRRLRAADGRRRRRLAVRGSVRDAAGGPSTSSTPPAPAGRAAGAERALRRRAGRAPQRGRGVGPARPRASARRSASPGCSTT